MYIHFSTLLPITALAAVVAAAPSDLAARTSGSSQCDTGSVQCCNNTYSQTDSTLTSILGLLGVVLPDVTGLVGIDCISLAVSGTGSVDACIQPVCCTGNTDNGLISFGCSPININV